MNKIELHILMLEDDPLDAELVKAQLLLLEEYNCIVQWATTKETYIEALQTGNPDIILSDYTLPQYNGLEALMDLKGVNKLIPFIFVTGTINEETAAGTIKAGAWDYVVKDRLFRLPLAIRGALQLKDEKLNTLIAEAKNRQLSMAVEQSPVHIIISNTENIIEYVNVKFTEVTGYSSDEAIGKNIAILVPDDKKEEYLQTFQKRFKYTDTWRGEFQSLKKDGSLFWEYYSISPLKNAKDEITHFIAVKEDITQRKLMEQKLIEALDNAERSDKLKDAFLQNLSHEIRTPLNAIVGFSDLLNGENDIPESLKNYTSIIKKSSNRLLSIVSDVITMSSIQTGHEKIINKPVDINKQFDDLLDIYKPIAQAKNLKLVFNKALPDSKLFIVTDEIKLTQILTNLINNALKYTHEGSIDVSYSLQGEWFEFCVKDTGIGINKEAHEFIFERFRQAEESIHSNYGGTGLGLSISRSFAQMLGGNLRVESEPDKGSAFYLSIPYLVQEVQIPVENPEPITLTRSNITILVAEDEIDNYKLIEVFLNLPDITLLHASDGSEALEICKQNPQINLVLMDIKMPVMDGIEAFREIRKIRNDLPVVAQTAYAFEKERRQFLEMGFNEWISKPIIKEELLKIIKVCLT
jgi:PAS domain S-box-containing protein